MQGLRLYKKEKLCSVTAIERLFSHHTATDTPAPRSAIAYPLRAVWAPARRSSDAPLAFLISVPKRRLRHAVQRVLMRRRIREAYRLNRHTYTAEMDCNTRLDVAFIYVASETLPYSTVEKAMIKLLKNISHDS
ncbi:MAG: ribonuclease P protein component [Muribaculaceae bacterium]|nr:ribonuclease P protein component [Muribaculaceae bacterium]